jgi:hypothetical protein
MTERPTEQTHPRLTGLDAPDRVSDAQSNAPSPTLPPMPSAPAERVEYRPQTSTAPERPSLADRLQEKLNSVRQTERPAERLTERPDTRSTDPQDQTSVRPAVQASTVAPEAPTTHEQGRPVLPPPAPDQAPPQPARRPADKRPARAARTKRPPRRARLRLTRVDPWSVMKTAFLLSIALGVVTIVSVLMVWSVLGAAGVWDSINTTVRDIVGDQASTPFTIQDYLGTDRVIGFTMLVAVIDVVLLTALATLAAFLYNMAAALLGGIDITLVEDER